jgi:hypothetical protein
MAEVVGGEGKGRNYPPHLFTSTEQKGGLKEEWEREGISLFLWVGGSIEKR